MLHTPFLPKYEDGRKIVSVPIRLLKRWSGDFLFVRQPNQSNAILDIKGSHYVAHVARVLKYTPFVPTQSTHLARLARKILAKPQQLVDSTNVVESDPATLMARVGSESESKVASSAIRAASPTLLSRKSFPVVNELLQRLGPLPAFYNSISPADIVALSDYKLTLGPSPDMCTYEKAMKHRDFKFHLKHLKALRACVGLTGDYPEPKYSLLREVKDRIADLTHFIACVLRYTRFYDQLLEDRSPIHFNGIQPAGFSSAVSIVPLVGSLQLVTGANHASEVLQKFGSFEEYINQRRWLVLGAPIPSLDAYELDHSNIWINDLTLTTERMENNAVDGEHSEPTPVQSSLPSFTDLMYHPVVSDVFIPPTTRAGRTTRVTRKYLQTAITANQQSDATSSLRPTSSQKCALFTFVGTTFLVGTAAVFTTLTHSCFSGSVFVCTFFSSPLLVLCF
jgi:hypothetical protein